MKMLMIVVALSSIASVSMAGFVPNTAASSQRRQMEEESSVQAGSNGIFDADGFVICGDDYMQIATGDGCLEKSSRSTGFFSSEEVKTVIPYREFLQMRKPGVKYMGIQYHSHKDRVYVFYKNQKPAKARTLK